MQSLQQSVAIYHNGHVQDHSQHSVDMMMRVGTYSDDSLCRDELRAAWAVYTPLLHAIDAGKVELLSYPYGTRGPPQSDVLVSKNGFVKNAEYKWEPMPNRRSFDMQRPPPPGRL